MVTSVNVAVEAQVVYCKSCWPKRTTLFMMVPSGGIQIYGRDGYFFLSGPFTMLSVTCYRCERPSTYDVRPTAPPS